MVSLADIEENIRLKHLGPGIWYKQQEAGITISWDGAINGGVCLAGMVKGGW